MKRGTEPITLGFAWFDREQWLLLTEVVPDRAELDESFEEWEKSALTAVAAMEAEGLRVEKIAIDVGELCVWCRSRKRPVDGGARSEYVAGILHKRYDAGV